MTKKGKRGSKKEPGEPFDVAFLARVTDVGGKVAAVGAALVAAHVGPETGAAVGLGVASGFAGLTAHLHARQRNKQVARAEALLEEFLGPDITDEAAIAAFKERVADDEDFEARLFEALRAQLEAVTTLVQPALVRLLRSYEGREPDPFFRGVCRMLQDVSNPEFRVLRAFLGEARTKTEKVVGGASGNGAPNTVTVRMARADEVYLGAGFSDGEQSLRILVGHPDSMHFRRIIKLLAAHDLAAGGDIGQHWEWPSASMSRDMLTALEALVLGGSETHFAG